MMMVRHGHRVIVLAYDVVGSKVYRVVNACGKAAHQGEMPQFGGTELAAESGQRVI